MVGTAGSTEGQYASTFHYRYGSRAVHDVALQDVPAIGQVAVEMTVMVVGVGWESRIRRDVACSVHNEL